MLKRHVPESEVLVLILHPFNFHLFLLFRLKLLTSTFLFVFNHRHRLKPNRSVPTETSSSFFLWKIPTHVHFGASDFFVLDRMAQNLDDGIMEKVIMGNSLTRSKMMMMMKCMMVRKMMTMLMMVMVKKMTLMTLQGAL